jgi:2'-5' RNA ligase
MAGTLRTFVALALDDAEREPLAGWAARALGRVPGLRLVPGANLHATLVFCGPLGEPDRERVVAITREEVGAGLRCRLAPRRVAVLGSVVAVTYDVVEGAEALLDLQSRLAVRLAAAALAALESRPWLAHVTVGRARRGVRPRIGRLEPPAGELSPSGVAVYTTVPMEGGVAYRPLVLLGHDANADGTGAAVPRGG